MRTGHCMIVWWTSLKVLVLVLPFLSEGIYQHLVVEMGVAKEGEDSVHLCDYPTVNEAYINERLESQIALAREVVSLWWCAS